MTLLNGFSAWLFLGLALAGLSGLVTIAYRVMTQGRRRQRLREARDHLEEAYDDGRIPEEFYENHRDVLDED